VLRCRSESDPLIDPEMWGSVQARGKDALIAMSEWGMSPRMFGGGLVLTLSDLGLISKVDVIPLQRFDAVWPAPDSQPVTLRRVTLEDVFQHKHEVGEGVLRRFFRPATLRVCICTMWPLAPPACMHVPGSSCAQSLAAH
jgi:hypothetical protein